jgi:hypothetical protein
MYRWFRFGVGGTEAAQCLREGKRGMTSRFRQFRQSPAVLLALIMAVSGLVYVSQTWSPSSYGLLLRQIGVEGPGIVFRSPRAIRSDEWAAVTPLTQATVHKGLERINRTSFYAEHLRINYGLPVFDWGLAFKPTMWLYPVAEPAYAYSFHWFATLAL